MKLIKSLFLLILASYLAINLSAEGRFSKPEFETEYQQPLTTAPAADAGFMDILDICLLFIGLTLASYFSLKKRYRRGIFYLTIFSVLYFGFYRKGCVCSVGSVQNIALAMGNAAYVLPVTVGILFLMPLTFTLFFSRSFCSSICPLGAVQDLLSYKPIKIPTSISKVLGLIPYIYLGFSFLIAFTNSDFIICRYDPFINIFRLHAGFQQIIYSVAFVILSILIARPYCRFLCPYGVLLGWMSKLSPHRVTITPCECIQCKLCENSCPFDAIVKPSPDKIPETRNQGVKRITILLILIPVMMFVSGFALSRLDNLLSRINSKVRLSHQIMLEDEGTITETTLETRTFRSQIKTVDELQQESQFIIQKYRIGGWILGTFLGLAFTFKLFTLSVHRKQEEYVTDPVNCFSCGRCWKSCPIEHKRLKEKSIDN